jgi:hypothetical protein
MKQRAAQSKFAISIELVDLGKQSVRVGGAQSEEEARGKVGSIVDLLRAGIFVAAEGNHDRQFDATEVFSVFAYSINSEGGFGDKVVETRIRPNGRAKQEKRAA